MQSEEQRMYLSKWIEMISLMLLVLGALNWGLIGLFKFNMVNFLAKHTFKSLEGIVYMLVGISALVHVLHRDYYLPFLGDAVYPCGSLLEKVPDGANTTVRIQTLPNVNVIYWAAEPSKQIQKNPWLAYSLYANAGVARANERGEAVLRVRSPASYSVGSIVPRVLSPHIHYRVCSNGGMLSSVKTVRI